MQARKDPPALRGGLFAEWGSKGCQLIMDLTSIARAANAQDGADVEYVRITGESAGRGTGVKSPVLGSKVEPQYTDGARQMGLGGVVLLRAVVDEEGIPTDITVLKPPGMGLDENAIACVRHWRFDPRKDGKAVRVRVTFDLRFRLLKGDQ